MERRIKELTLKEWLEIKSEYENKYHSVRYMPYSFEHPYQTRITCHSRNGRHMETIRVTDAGAAKCC